MNEQRSTQTPQPSEQSVRRAIATVLRIDSAEVLDNAYANYLKGPKEFAQYHIPEIERTALAFDAQDTAWQAKLDKAVAETERETREAALEEAMQVCRNHFGPMTSMAESTWAEVIYNEIFLLKIKE